MERTYSEIVPAPIQGDIPDPPKPPDKSDRALPASPKKPTDRKD